MFRPGGFNPVVEVVGMAGARTRDMQPRVYVVQVRVVVEREGSAEALKVRVDPGEMPGVSLWDDVCEVTMPAGSKRKTIIAAALAKTPVELPATLRILDADAAREFPVGLRPRDPELVIG
jgi:hypothetical protein